MINKQDRTNNPYDICIFRPDSECKECSLRTQLDCHFDLKKLLRFVSAFFFIVIVSAVALIFNGLIKEFYIFLIILGLFSVIFFEFWEIRILCSHCLFYAEKKKTIRCYGNYGSLKVWKYHPEPIGRSEKIQLIIGFIVFILILLLPSIILILNKYYLWAIPPIIGLITGGYIIKKFHCRKCFNFSCPFNTMPKVIVDEFLKRNPVIKKAWEKNG